MLPGALHEIGTVHPIPARRRSRDEAAVRNVVFDRARAAGGSGGDLPRKDIVYWQAFTPGGESDLSARHQQVVLKKKCPAIETIIQYKPGAGGGLMRAQMNNLPGDGFNVVGINLPHIVFQPLEGEVQYKTPDVTPVFWFQCALRRASGQPCVNCITPWVASRQAWRRRIGVACGCASIGLDA